MISKEMEFIAEGIMLLLNTERFSKNEKAMAWVDKYREVFPKRVPFGGPINEEDDTS